MGAFGRTISNSPYGDDIFDRSYNSMWLGTPSTLNIDGLREIQAKTKTGGLPATLTPVPTVNSNSNRLAMQSAQDRH